MHKTQPLNKPHHWITITLLAILSYSTAWANTNNGFTLEQGDLEVVDGTVKAPKFVGGGSTPIGSVIAFMGVEVPNGWMAANGSGISRTEYPELFSTIGVMYGNGNNTTTFNIPDLRGYFLRGFDDGANNDPDASTRSDRGDGTTGDNIGTKQEDAFQGHTHNTTNYIAQGNLQGSRFAGAPGNGGQTSDNLSGPISDGTNGTPRTASETRPKNINVLYIIRVR